MSSYITSSAELAVIVDAVNRACHVDARLPEHVFVKSPKAVGVIEDVQVAREELGRMLQYQVRRCGDAALFILAIDPPPEFWRKYDAFGAFRVPVNAAADVYARAWTDVSSGLESATAFVYEAKVVVMTSASGGFAVWFEREREMAVVADFDGDLDWGAPEVEALTWLAMDDILQLAGMTYYPRVVPEEVAVQWRRNYGALLKS